MCCKVPCKSQSELELQHQAASSIDDLVVPRFLGSGLGLPRKGGHPLSRPWAPPRAYHINTQGEGITADRELRKTKTRRLPVYASFSTTQRTPSPNSFLDGTSTVSLSDPLRGLYHLLPPNASWVPTPALQAASWDLDTWIPPINLVPVTGHHPFLQALSSVWSSSEDDKGSRGGLESAGHP